MLLGKLNSTRGLNRNFQRHQFETQQKCECIKARNDLNALSTQAQVANGEKSGWQHCCGQATFQTAPENHTGNHNNLAARGLFHESTRFSIK